MAPNPRLALLLIAMVGLSGCNQPDSASQTSKPEGSPAVATNTQKENVDLIADAYLFGYPLVLVDVTRQV